MLLAAEVTPGEPVTGEAAERHRYNRRKSGREHTVQKVGPEVATGKKRHVVLHGRPEDKDRCRRELGDPRLERRKNHPQYRHQRPEQHEEEDGVEYYLFARTTARRRSRHLASPLLSRIRTNTFATKIENTSIPSPMAAAYPRSKKRNAVSYNLIGMILVVLPGPPLVVTVMMSK